MKKFKYIILLLIVLILTGCVANRRNSFVKNHPELSDSIKKSILAGQIKKGMTKEQVEISWGKPNGVANEQYGIFTGKHDEWLYSFRYFPRDKYEHPKNQETKYYWLRFKKGKLFSWKESLTLSDVEKWFDFLR